jgi:hypothetical protein
VTGPAYRYRAVVTAVHDGDTITADVLLGFHITRSQVFRLLGCNARELADPGGRRLTTIWSRRSSAPP